MKRIFKLSAYQEVRAIDFGEDVVDLIRKGKIGMLKGKEFDWREDTENLQTSDCPFYIGAIPIFLSSKIKSVVRRLDCEPIPFTVERIGYTMLIPKTIPGNLIDREKSNLREFRSGKIMNIKNPVLRESREMNGMFRLQEYDLPSFVDEETKKILERCNFEDLRFEEIKVIPESIMKHFSERHKEYFRQSI